MPNFQFPHFEFDESNVGDRPNLSASSNRIGVVAQFTRGSREFKLISSLEDLHEVYKVDNKTGSVAIQAAMDQGANDFGVIRVMGAGVQAHADLMLSGTRAAADNQLGIKVTDKDGNVTRLHSLIPLVSNSTDTLTLAGQIAQAMSLVSDMPVNGVSDGAGNVVLQAVKDGADGNSIQVEFYLGREIGNAFERVSLADTTVQVGPGALRIEGESYAYAGGSQAFTADVVQLLVAKAVAADKTATIRAVNSPYSPLPDEAVVGDWNGADYAARAAGSYATALGLTFAPALHVPVSLAGGVNGPKAASLTVPVFRYLKTPFKGVARAALTLGGVAPVDPAVETLTLTFAAASDTRVVTYEVLPADDTAAKVATALVAAINTAFDDDAVVASLDPADDKKVLLRSDFAWDLTAADDLSGAAYTVAKSGDVAFDDGGKVVLNGGVMVFQGDEEHAPAEQEVSVVNGSAIVYNSDPSSKKLSMYPTLMPNLVDSELIVAYYQDGTLRLVEAQESDMLLVEYPYEGQDGNDVQATITYLPGARSFDLIVNKVSADGERRNDVIRELRLDLINEVNGDDYFLKAEGSSMVRVKWIGTDAMASEMPAMVSDQKLGGGYDGPAITLDDYRRALQAMSLEPVNILICPLTPEEHARIGKDINTLLGTQAETGVTENEGLRVAVVSAPPGLTPEMARDYTQGSGLRGSKQVVMVAGWVTYSKRTGLKRKSVDPVGFYAGHLAATPVQASPAARTSSPFFRGITEVDSRKGNNAFEEYTKAGLEVIILDPATGGFHCLNGRTLAIDPAWYWVSIRRTYNKIRMELFQNLQWVKSEPNTPEIRLRVSTQVDNYLGALRMQGVIVDFAPTKCNDENNPPKLVKQGLMAIDITPSFVYPADYPKVKISRLESLSIPTAGV